MKRSQIWFPSIIVLLLASSYGIYSILDTSALEQHYIFNPQTLHALSTTAIQLHGNNTRALVANIVEQLKADREVAPYLSKDEEWCFNSEPAYRKMPIAWKSANFDSNQLDAGGAMGAMYIIHASITEYLIIFGTAIGTEGHTGRHTADDYFHIIQGTQLAFRPGSFEAEVYPQGSVHHLRRGEVKQYKMESSCFALEYARGFIPGMFLFGFADGVTSTMDLTTLWTMTRIIGREMIGNLLRGKL